MRVVCRRRRCVTRHVVALVTVLVVRRGMVLLRVHHAPPNHPSVVGKWWQAFAYAAVGVVIPTKEVQ